MALFTGSRTWLGHGGGGPKPVTGSQMVGMTRRCVIWEKGAVAGKTFLPFYFSSACSRFLNFADPTICEPGTG